MLLHAHPLNLQREARGQATLNSVWIWGGGTATIVGKSAFSHVWSDDALARALAIQSGTTVAREPPDAANVIAAGGDALVVLPALPAATADYAAWQSAVEQFEAQWALPCHAALKKSAASLTLITHNPVQNRQFTITGSTLWRWWRKSHTLDTYV